MINFEINKRVLRNTTDLFYPNSAIKCLMSNLSINRMLKLANKYNSVTFCK